MIIYMIVASDWSLKYWFVTYFLIIYVGFMVIYSIMQFGNIQITNYG